MHRTDAIATLENGVRIEYILAEPDGGTRAKETLVLIHGYPQTNYQFRHVLKPFTRAGLRVVAPSYRGAGNSSADSQGGYDKLTLAGDLLELLVSHLKLSSFIVLGHDIGSMVATALAFIPGAREPLKALIVGECPQPGTSLYRKSTSDPEMILKDVFHFAFHQPRGLAEMLTAGKEEQYLVHFYERLAYNPAFLTPADIAHYASIFRRAGKMQAGFELYRAFEQDHGDILAHVKDGGKLPASLPVLSTGGKESAFTVMLGEAMKEIAENVTTSEGVPGAAHWVAEEAPQGFVDEVLGFLRSQKLM
ncbi:hypothetical protein JCM10449v2_000758 [Rhodotorula kratochvilovae]